MSRADFEKPSEEEIISNSKPDHLYSHKFEKGRFFQVVHEDEEGFEIKLAPRTMFKAVYIKDHDDIEGIEIIKKTHISTQRVKLNKFNFAQLKAFLSFINEIDLKGITERRLKLYDDQELDEETVKTVKTLLSKKGGGEIVEALIQEGAITSHDIVNTGFRRRGLQIFQRMLENSGYWKKYEEENELKTNQEEKVWQYFLQKNEWIFGYGLDYRYQQVLQREAHLSEQEVDGTNAVIGDYLLGDKRFTTFVELKKPSTKIFGKNSNRSNSWTLSKELFNSVSQILEHKASGIIRLDSQQFANGEPIKQKAYDSKVILIIGRWNEIEESQSTREKEIKKKTFELFRTDSRNIEILTFDELYDRASFIVEGNSSPKIESTENEIDEFDNIDDDLPF